MSDLSRLGVLVVDTSPSMRSQLRNMLGDLGINSVMFAVSAGAAVRTLREKRFDLILCEYHLGTGQDGQHLLEDLRQNEIIPLDTLFVMVTGERQYERVLGTAELTPNDYILKPFTAEMLHQRLLRALARRAAFAGIHHAIALGDLPEAADLCARKAGQDGPYRGDFLRLRAELLLRLGKPAEARSLYEEILRQQELPWARLGLAKCNFQLGAYPAAVDILQTLVQECPQFMDAYDWLARAQEAAGARSAACQTLDAAARLSPNRIARQRQLGELAFADGDVATAEKALGEVVRQGRYSDFRTPEDHVRLVQAQLANDHLMDAAATVRELESSMAGLPATPLCSALSASLIYRHNGDADKARTVLQTAVTQTAAPSELLSLDLRKTLMRECFDQHLDAEGEQLALDTLRNAGDDKTVEAVRNILQNSGHAALSDDLERRTHQEVKGLIAAGASKAQKGDFDGAVAEMLAAVRKLPGNSHVIFNAALALLRHIEHNGWNDRLSAQARILIERLRRQDPGNARLPALSEFLHVLIQTHRKAPRPVQTFPTA